MRSKFQNQQFTIHCQDFLNLILLVKNVISGGKSFHIFISRSIHYSTLLCIGFWNRK